MHQEVNLFIQKVKDKYPDYFNKKKVLEVGSLDINGSVRKYFTDCDYWGLDVGKGPGVDIVCPIHEYLDESQHDVVISTEMLEHDKYWKDSLQSMYNNLKPGGLLILTCAGPNRQEHGTTRTTPQDSPFTTDYYRNISIEDFISILPPQDFQISEIKYAGDKIDLQFYGIKK